MQCEKCTCIKTQTDINSYKGISMAYLPTFKFHKWEKMLKKEDIPTFPILYYIQIFEKRETHGKISLFFASKWGNVPPKEERGTVGKSAMDLYVRNCSNQCSPLGAFLLPPGPPSCPGTWPAFRSWFRRSTSSSVLALAMAFCWNHVKSGEKISLVL